MATITMPQLGESVTEGTILQWFKQPGDAVKFDEPLCEIETEKVTAELPSPFEGTMGEILVAEGETVAVDEALCSISTDAGPMAISEADTRVATPAPVEVTRSSSGGPPSTREPEPTEAEPSEAPATAAEEPSQAESAPKGFSPAVMRLAREHDIDPAKVEGTGRGGRVTRKDLLAAVEAGKEAPPPPEEEERPVTRTLGAAKPKPAATSSESDDYEEVSLSPTRRTIAKRMQQSNVEAPQAWTVVEADVTGLMALRNREKEAFEAEHRVSLTMLPYFTQAVCGALREFPILNSRWEGEELRRYHALNIGIAVASDSGLVVPVIQRAGDLSVPGLAKRIHDLASRARSRRLGLEDIEGGTFTVNNTGAFGSISSKPIVNYPQVAIVTMERAVKRAVVRSDDAIAIRWMMNICLSFDHRALDGSEAGGFMAALKERLEAFE